MTLLAPAAARSQVSAYRTLLVADAGLSTTVFDSSVNAAFPAALGADGILLWPAAGVIQGDSIATRFFSRQPLMQAAKFSWQPLRVDFSSDSSLAVIAGVAIVDRAAGVPFPPIHRIGRYLAAWRDVDGKWQLSAFAFVNLIATSETLWNEAISPASLPVIHSVGSAAIFIAADSSFSVDASATSNSTAFTKWAAPDAAIFAYSGELVYGPQRIGIALRSNTALREWRPVAAGSSADSTLGWTVSESTNRPAAGGTPTNSKSLTFWRRLPDGTVRFIADGGNARP
jgi:hypothetical protein